MVVWCFIIVERKLRKKKRAKKRGDFVFATCIVFACLSVSFVTEGLINDTRMALCMDEEYLAIQYSLDVYVYVC